MNRRLNFCVKTDVGHKRSKNEDSYLVIDGATYHVPPSAEEKLFAVADGMSGHIGGAIASKMAIKGLQKHCMSLFNRTDAKLAHITGEAITRKLENIVLKIDEEISKAASATKRLEYMGTTLSVLFIQQDGAFIAHVGDSRVYLLRNGLLEKITYDDTIAQLSVDMGQMTEEDAQTHPLRHALVQVLGQGVDQVHTYVRDIQGGDIFLLCTDGLYEEIPDDEIKKIIRQDRLNVLPCDDLIGAALHNAGKDNITVILVEIS